MAANTVTTFAMTGMREDLANIIYNISPDETPLLNGIGMGRATNTYHEWQTDTLTAPNTDNAVIQGDDATIDASTMPTRIGNRTQLMDKTIEVSSTAQAIDHAGMSNPMDYLAARKSVEFRRDIEAILFANQAMVTGTAALASRMGTLGAWVGTNDSFGATGASPVGANGTAARTDGTQRPFVETDLQAVLQDAWTNGGTPDTLYVGGFNKRQVSRNFQGIATAMREVDGKTSVSSIDTLDTDFGRIRVIANRQQRTRDAWLIDHNLLSLDYLQPMQRKPLPSQGHYERELFWCEATLCVKNETGLGGVFDLTTS